MTDITAPAAPATPAAGTPPATPAAPVVVALDTGTPPTTPATPPADPAPLVADQAGKSYTYEKTGDAGLDYALGYVGRLGFGPDHDAVAAATKGDFSLLRAELATLGDKAPGYAEVVAIAETAYKKTTEANTVAAKAVSDYAVKAAESPERWAEVQKWASANADPAEKAQINAALKAGGIQAKSTIDWLVKCYDKSANAVKSPKSAAKADAAGSPPSSGALTSSEYSAEVQKLMRANAGRDIGDKPEYAALQARRLAGKKLGK